MGHYCRIKKLIQIIDKRIRIETHTHTHIYIYIYKFGGHKFEVVISLFSLSDSCSLERIDDFLAIICLNHLFHRFFFLIYGFSFPIKWFFPY